MTGFIGSRLVGTAMKNGYEVRGLARREWLGPPAIPLRERVFGRLPYFIPSGALEGCDAVVHCGVSTASDLGVARAVNVTGTLELARAARDAGVRCFVFLSTQSARSDTASTYGRTKHEAERLLLADPTFRAIVLRPGLVCGRGGLFWRLATIVRRAPLVPLLAADAPVQPLFVDDLTNAILRCVAEPSPYMGRVIEIGLERSLTLREFVRAIADQAASSRRIVPLPTAPVAFAVRASERLGLRLPISSTNVVGARDVRVMGTSAGNAALNLPRRSVEDIVQLSLAPTDDDQTLIPSPMRTLLIGAGRIGIVHAVTLSRLPGVFLAGVLDRRAEAIGLLRSVGIRAPGSAAGIPGALYEAAVIATPPSTHVELAKSRVELGERVLIEKPAARVPSDLPELKALADRCGEQALVGYLMPRMRHLRPWLAKLRAGELGAIRSFTGMTLLSLIDARSGPRWETTKAASGGGVLINSATHVLSLIDAAFGPPKNTRTELLSRHSREVEDCAVIHFDYGAFAGILYASWCAPGFGRQENRLIVWTDQGKLTLSSTTAVFEQHGSFAIDHQLDHDLGFNLAPDYAGGGIAAELRELAGHRFDGPLAEPMTLAKGVALERLVFDLYGQGRNVASFSPVPAEVRSSTRSPGSVSDVYLDIRDVAPDVVRLAVRAQPAGLLMRATQLSSVTGKTRIAITVPDFLGYTRLITDHQRGALLRRLGPRGLLAAATTAAASVARERLIGFWSVAAALLSAELSRIPSDFDGTLLLHPYLADLAIALDRPRILQGLIDQMRSKRNARVGVHTNLGPEAANAMLLLERGPDVLSALTSPNGSEFETIRGWLEHDSRQAKIELMAEVGPAPLCVHDHALSHRTRWAAPDRPLVVSALTVAANDPSVIEQWRRDWKSIFPDLEPLPLEWVA